MVSNSFARSIGLGGSKAIKGKTSIATGGGYACPIGEHSSNGDLKGHSMPKPSKGYDQKQVKGDHIDKRPTTRDPNQKGGK